MNWLENNPVGLGLAAIAAALVVVAVGLGLWWSRPVSPDLAGLDASGVDAPGAIVSKLELGPAKDYDVINERPLFNQSRRPEVMAANGAGDELEDLAGAEVTDPPDVRLTGVVITPEGSFVSLTPNAGGEPLLVRSGDALEGEYAGWNVDSVDARMVRLQSTRGQDYELELVVHDQPIEEPPEPAPPPSAEEEQGDEEQLSRAEEIRQRIAERREQLRAEAEAVGEDDAAAAQAQRNRYQEAIRAMIQPNKDNKDENDSGKD